MKAYGKSWDYNVYDCRYCLYWRGKEKGCVYPDGYCCPTEQKVAIDYADLILMDDQPSKIPLAIKSARKTMRIVYQNIYFSIGIKVFVLIMSAIGFSNMRYLPM